MFRYSSNRGINRFLEAQKREYETAYQEISEGKKRSHWIWYIYPQIKGLGMSYMDSEYSIKSIQETLEYISHKDLYKRLKEMTSLLLDIKHNDIKEVMWYPDDLKLRSCMTLFYACTGNAIFQKVIDKFYKGERDLKTIIILKGMLEKEKNKIPNNISKTIETNLNIMEKEEKIKLEKKKEEEKKILRQKEKEKEKEREMERENEQNKLKKQNENNTSISNNNKYEFIYQKKVVEKNNEEEIKAKQVEDKNENQNMKIQKDGNIEVKNIDNNMDNTVNKNRIENSNLMHQEHINKDENDIQNKNKLISYEINKENSNLKKEIKGPKNSFRKPIERP